MPVSRNHGRCAGAVAWVRNQILNLPASALSASMASRALRRAGGAADGLESVDKGLPPGRLLPPTLASGITGRAPSLHLPPEGGGRPALAGREGMAALQRTLHRCHPTPDCLRQSDPPPPGEGGHMDRPPQAGKESRCHFAPIWRKFNKCYGDGRLELGLGQLDLAGEGMKVTHQPPHDCPRFPEIRSCLVR